MAKKKTRAKNAHKRTAKRKKIAARKQTRSAAKVRAARRKPAPRKRASKKRAPRRSGATMRGRSVSERKLIKFARSTKGRRLVLLFDNKLDVPQTRGFDDKVGDWTGVRALGAVDLAPIFTDVDNIDRIEARARRTERDYPWPRFRNAFFLHLKPGADTQEVLRLLNNRPDIIRWAYEDAEPGPAASEAACNGPSAHLNGAQVGVAAQAAWDVEGGLGEHQICVDVEQGWVMTHARLAHPERVDLLCGTMLQVALDHGTQVLGILGGSHPPLGCRGLAPEAAAFRLASFLPQAAVDANLLTVPHPNAVPPATSVYEAFGEAVKFLLDPTGQFPNSAGGVLLIERQRATDGLPIEILPLLRQLIRAATHTHGITVVEPAGNGFGKDLDLAPGLPGSSSAFPLVRDVVRLLESTRSRRELTHTTLGVIAIGICADRCAPG